MGSCAAPSAKGDDKFITTDYLQQCHPTNVAEAIARTGAPLVDTSSGVESAPGVKDTDKITNFAFAVRLA
ncbi:hypothetical protein [Escherichia coli]|uniref:phosphoribosylanthranilate isomerase n=1 Tax=Escherichia coli TaxID=562 RepID=UPI00301E625D